MSLFEARSSFFYPFIDSFACHSREREKLNFLKANLNKKNDLMIIDLKWIESNYKTYVCLCGCGRRGELWNQKKKNGSA